MTTSLTTPGDSTDKWKSDTHTKLSGDELNNAITALSNTSFVNKFPRVDRNFADPPVPLQNIGLFSFIPAKGATPNKNGVFGFAKIRGNYNTDVEASAKAESIIRSIDSAHTIFQAYVGRPFPVTLSEDYCSETTEVDIRRETTEAVSDSIKSKKLDDQKIAKELHDREEELMRDTTPGMIDAETVNQDHYVTMNVKKAQLSWTYLEHVKKLKEVRDILNNTTAEIKRIDKTNPEFRDTFLEKYIAAREKSGLSHKKEDFNEGFVRYLVEDVELPGMTIDDDDERINTIMNDNETKPASLISSSVHTKKED
uniref:Uncharacterized protein n=1 Tax=viral metagenome TaxID=1070528 RepID=A0A6C0LW32_9ZZZZ